MRNQLNHGTFSSRLCGTLVRLLESMYARVRMWGRKYYMPAAATAIILIVYAAMLSQVSMCFN